ncbi:MAG: protein phosphatase 2C domain-containing protein [Pseudomonadota bacterium]|nr:protein phosphatase 2C domain-containing protein [Pseudomonadota bacterium]
MLPILPNEPVQVGDVLYQPAFGFAVVEERDATGATLRWEHQGSSHPVHVRHGALATAYRKCLPTGLLARSVRDPDGARAFIEAEPLAGLAMLLVDVDGQATAADVRDWFLARRLSSTARFDAWWDAVRPLIEADDRFVRTHARIARDPTAMEAVSDEVSQETVSLREGVDRSELLRARPRPLPTPGTLPRAAAFGFAIRLARALADVHLQGLGIVPDPTTVAIAGDTIQFRTRGAPTPQGRRDDVRFVLRILLEQVLGPLPDPGDLAESDLAPQLGALGVPLPLELLAVVMEGMAADGSLRPADGFALWERLHVAEAVHAMRQSAPWAHQAGACAGFNTHIGVLKSLQTQTNQDAFLLVGEPTFSLLCVADGISHCNAGSGDLASGLTIRTLKLWWAEQADALRDAEPPRIHAALAGSLARANEIVCDAALRLAGPDTDNFIPMGTTVVAAITRGNRVHLAALGDSRAYLVGRHGVSLLTYDQNLQSERLREASTGRRVSWADAGAPLVGYVGHFDPDGAPAPAPLYTRIVAMLPGEWLILCSDGLTDYGGPEEAAVALLIGNAVRDARGATLTAQAMEVCRSLVDAANRGVGGDNVTVLALTLSADYGATPHDGPVPS